MSGGEEGRVREAGGVCAGAEPADGGVDPSRADADDAETFRAPDPRRPPGFPYANSDRFLVLINRNAAGGRASDLRRRLAAAFADRGVPFDLVETADAAEALRVAGEAARGGYRAVCAAGGDGTVAQALRGTAGTEVPVAILPFGTGNQLARNFGIPVSLEGSVRVAVGGRVEPIDLGRADGEYFALMAGAGLDARVMADATAAMKQRFGFGAYLFSGLKHVMTPRIADFRIRADDRELEIRASMVLVANVGQLAAGPLPMEVQVGPRVSFSDGLLDVCVFAPGNLTEMAAVLWKVARQQYAGDDRMLFLQAREVSVESDPPVAAQVDGEVAGVTPLRADVAPLAGRLLVPA